MQDELAIFGNLCAVDPEGLVEEMPGPKGYEHNWIYVGGTGLPSKQVIEQLPHTRGAVARARQEYVAPLPRSVLLNDGRAVHPHDRDGDKVAIYDPSSRRREVVAASRIRTGGPTKQTPGKIKLTGPQHNVARYRFEDVRTGNEKEDDELGGELIGNHLVVYDAALAAITLDMAAEIMRDNILDRYEVRKMQAELTATLALRRKVVGLVPPSGNH